MIIRSDQLIDLGKTNEVEFLKRVKNLFRTILSDEEVEHLGIGNFDKCIHSFYDNSIKYGCTKEIEIVKYIILCLSVGVDFMENKKFEVADRKSFTDGENIESILDELFESFYVSDTFFLNEYKLFR